MHTGEDSAVLRKVMDIAIRVLIVIIIIGMLAYQVSARNYFWELYDQDIIGYGDWGDTLLIYRISPFLIAMAILSLLRKKAVYTQELCKGSVQNAFWFVKMVVWCTAFVFWMTEVIIDLCTTATTTESIWLFYEETGFLVIKYFGETLFLVYLIEMLHSCWPELKKEWCSDRFWIGKILMSLKVLFFDRLSRAGTVRGKLFAAVECVFLVYAVVSNMFEGIIHPYGFLQSPCGLFTWFSTAVMFIPYNHLWPFAILQFVKTIVGDDL